MSSSPPHARNWLNNRPQAKSNVRLPRPAEMKWSSCRLSCPVNEPNWKKRRSVSHSASRKFRPALLLWNSRKSN
jgi:hypothetical protein